MDTLSNVFFAVANKNLHTRKDIALHLGVSVVTVGKAVEVLTKSGLLCMIGKGSGDIGRKSDFIDVSQSKKALLVNLCGKNLSYSFSPMSDDFIDIHTIPYSHSLDFADNVSLLISAIKRRLDIAPCKILIAVPGDPDNGKISNSYLKDYSGINIKELFENQGLDPDVMISGAVAVESCDDFGENDVFVSVSDNIWGTFGRGRTEKWSNVPVDNRLNLTYADSLQCSLEEERIAMYSLRFLSALENILTPDRILFSCDRLTDDTINDIKSKISKLECVSGGTLIFNGLMKLASMEILKEISNKR